METQDLNLTLKEISIMEGITSPFVVEYYGSFTKKTRELWILMEYCAAGSVTDVMRMTETCITEEEIAVISRQVLEGLKYLHSRNQIHRDIKSGYTMVLRDEVPSEHGLTNMEKIGISL